jgi:hypothetical protein
MIRLQLRFVERDGKRILQQRAVGLVRGKPTTWMEKIFGGDITVAHSAWEDVPTEKEEQA